MCGASSFAPLECRAQMAHGIVVPVPSHVALEQHIVEQQLAARRRSKLGDTEKIRECSMPTADQKRENRPVACSALPPQKAAVHKQCNLAVY